MKKYTALMILLIVLVLVTACSKQTSEKQQVAGSGDGVMNEEEINSIEQEIETINSIEDEINLGELDNLEEELDLEI